MFWKYNLPALLWALIILVLILMPGRHMPELEQDFLISTDKLAHFGVFLVLSFLTARGLRKQQKHQGLKPKYAFYTLLITVTYGLLLESLQLLSDGRSVEWYDALANTLGCLGGLLFFIVLKKA